MVHVHIYLYTLSVPSLIEKMSSSKVKHLSLEIPIATAFSSNNPPLPKTPIQDISCPSFPSYSLEEMEEDKKEEVKDSPLFPTKVKLDANLEFISDEKENVFLQDKDGC